MADLIRWLGDDGDDAAAAQFGADCPRGVGLVATDAVGAGPRYTAAPGDFQVCQQVLEGRSVVGLPGGDQDHQGAAGTVHEVVDLAGQSTA